MATAMSIAAKPIADPGAEPHRRIAGVENPEAEPRRGESLEILRIGEEGEHVVETGGHSLDMAELIAQQALRSQAVRVPCPADPGRRERGVREAPLTRKSASTGLWSLITLPALLMTAGCGGASTTQARSSSIQLRETKSPSQ